MKSINAYDIQIVIKQRQHPDNGEDGITVHSYFVTSVKTDAFRLKDADDALYEAKTKASAIQQIIVGIGTLFEPTK